jgi:5-methylcytosine-specific restriction endonuclease McrA
MPDPRVSAELRQRVTEHARRWCEYCRSQAQYATESFSVEHVLARAKGGSTTLENLALAGQGCNNYKYDKGCRRITHMSCWSLPGVAQ